MSDTLAYTYGGLQCRLYFPSSEDILSINQKFIIGLGSLYIWLCLDNTSLLIDYHVDICKITVFHFDSILLQFQEFTTHTVHPDTTNAERSSKRGYKQLYQGKKT